MSCSMFFWDNGTNPTSYHYSSFPWLWHPWLPNLLMGNHGYLTTRTFGVNGRSFPLNPGLTWQHVGEQIMLNHAKQHLQRHRFELQQRIFRLCVSSGISLSCSSGCFFSITGTPTTASSRLIWGECYATWWRTTWVGQSGGLRFGPVYA